jgi:hypothetical protein
MSIVLLRILTRKSVLGFGLYKDWTVQNMIDMCNLRELLDIYYNCRNIDFSQDLKDELCIYGEREIDKRNPPKHRYIPNAGFYTRICMKEIIDKKSESQRAIEFGLKRKFKFESKRRLNRKEKWTKSTIYSKGALQAMNHGHNKKT